jgi:predicted lipid-binding transport protein (Tim44 family)
MKQENRFWWTIRISWPLLGGAWGAWLGFGGYLGLPRNADSFATLFALGFYSLFAWAGLLVGVASGAMIGGLFERLLQRFGAGTAGAVSVATVLNAIVLWQIVGFVQTTYPGLRPPAAERPVTATTGIASQNACARQPPANSGERERWNSECR